MQQPQSTARRQKSSMALDNEARETIATYSTSPDRAVYADVEGVWAKNRSHRTCIATARAIAPRCREGADE